MSEARLSLRTLPVQFIPLFAAAASHPRKGQFLSRCRRILATAKREGRDVARVQRREILLLFAGRGDGQADRFEVQLDGRARIISKVNVNGDQTRGVRRFLAEARFVVVRLQQRVGRDQQPLVRIVRGQGCRVFRRRPLRPGGNGTE